MLDLIFYVHLTTQIVEIFHSLCLFLNSRLSINKFLFNTGLIKVPD